MNDRVMRFFQDEIRMQCQFVLLGSRQLEAALSAPIEPGPDMNTSTWCALQTILVSAANISKLCWGSGRPERQEPIAARRLPLRESIGVKDSSPLNSTDLRNSFEHFDERIETWFSGHAQGTYIGRNIGGGNAITSTFGGTSTRFGHYEPATGIVEFWEHSASVPEIVREASVILSRVRAARGD